MSNGKNGDEQVDIVRSKARGYRQDEVIKEYFSNRFRPAPYSYSIPPT